MFLSVSPSRSLYPYLSFLFSFLLFVCILSDNDGAGLTSCTCCQIELKFSSELCFRPVAQCCFFTSFFWDLEVDAYGYRPRSVLHLFVKFHDWLLFESEFRFESLVGNVNQCFSLLNTVRYRMCMFSDTSNFQLSTIDCSFHMNHNRLMHWFIQKRKSANLALSSRLFCPLPKTHRNLLRWR